MATIYDKEYYRIKQKEHREREKELKLLYESLANNGESFTEFLNRNKDIKIRYHAWEKMPNETDEEFKNRMSGRNLIKVKFKAWEKMPNETDEEFKNRFHSKKLNT